MLLHSDNFLNVPDITTCLSHCASPVLEVGIVNMVKSAEQSARKWVKYDLFLSL